MKFTNLGLLFLAGVLAASGADLRLIDAAKHGDVKAVRTLLAQHVPLNSAEPDGSTALHEAVRSDNPEIADELIAAGADVKAATRYNITPLSLACANGNATMIEHLLKAGADANATSEQGQTALMTAALTGKPDAVKVLLAHGAKVDVIEPVKGQTALMWAASKGNTAAAELLIEFGAVVKTKSTGGFTPLLFAVRSGHVDTVEALLKHGADVNDAAPDTTSALGMAIVNEYFDVGKVLVDHGANPNAPDPRVSALHAIAWLRKPGSDAGAALARRPAGNPEPHGNSFELAEDLLNHGANPNVRVSWKEKVFDRDTGTMINPPSIILGRHFVTFVGATPFYIAARAGDAPYMRLLAAYGADPKIPNVIGVTPLMVAAGMDYWEGESPGPFTGDTEPERLDAVKAALELGNDVNAACNFGDYKMDGDPEYLLKFPPKNLPELQARPVMADPRWTGSTALHSAVISNQPSIVQYLVDHGADLNAKNGSGWTPLMVAHGVFFANSGKEYPAAEEIITKALKAQGAQVAGLTKAAN